MIIANSLKKKTHRLLTFYHQPVVFRKVEHHLPALRWPYYGEVYVKLSAAITVRQEIDNDVNYNVNNHRLSCTVEVWAIEKLLSVSTE